MRQKLFSITLKDCRIDTFTVGGHGGAGKDTSNTGVRVVHLASGASGEGTRSRSQLTNKRAAFVQMAESNKFQLWARQKASELGLRKSTAEWIEETLKPANLLVEVRGETGRWEVVPFELGDGGE